MAFCRLSGAECRRPCPPPRPAPLWPREVPAEDVVASINRRHALGHATGALGRAGVLVHQFDRTMSAGSEWTPSSSHVSCSLINRGVPWLYSPSTPGFVLSPTHARLRCVYATDGGTTGTPDGCGRRPRCRGRRWWMCNWPPAQLAQMLAAHAAHNCKGWNEVVVSRADWQGALPHLVEAVFFIRGTPQGKARRVHASFARRFGQPLLPLLSYDPLNRTAPFRRVRAGNRTTGTG